MIEELTMKHCLIKKGRTLKLILFSKYFSFKYNKKKSLIFINNG